MNGLAEGVSGWVDSPAPLVLLCSGIVLCAWEWTRLRCTARPHAGPEFLGVVTLLWALGAPGAPLAEPGVIFVGAAGACVILGVGPALLATFLALCAVFVYEGLPFARLPLEFVARGACPVLVAHTLLLCTRASCASPARDVLAAGAAGAAGAACAAIAAFTLPGTGVVPSLTAPEIIAVAVLLAFVEAQLSVLGRGAQRMLGDPDHADHDVL